MTGSPGSRQWMLRRVEGKQERKERKLIREGIPSRRDKYI